MSLLIDLRYACRGLRRSGGAVAFVVLTLATGIAGTTAMWSLYDAVVLALAVAFLSSRFVVHFFFEVEPLDPGAWAGSVVILLSAGALATLVPACRGARVDPIGSLRGD